MIKIRLIKYAMKIMGKIRHALINIQLKIIIQMIIIHILVSTFCWISWNVNEINFILIDIRYLFIKKIKFY